MTRPWMVISFLLLVHATDIAKIEHNHRQGCDDVAVFSPTKTAPPLLIQHCPNTAFGSVESEGKWVPGDWSPKGMKLP